MYLDPSGGKAGSSLETIYGAAASGTLKVDPQTGETTLKFLSDVAELTERMRRSGAGLAVKTPLGGGFGEQVGAFNERLAAGGPHSFQEVLATFSRELEMLKEAVTRSIEAYRTADGGAVSAVASAGRSR
ncbi:hypothetical protein [Actinophytocola sp.]|uniref:hypothetical protein n=1 Tax=Actinophytocola sp. TaxID=1872138 RepID=UPI002D7E5E65|nr:hypothetical protein [Actinophytocola sp.]HET9139892.1 hypothetical protein [Actinophytocola sp.]